MTMRAAAVALAEKGFRVFPCLINGKFPAVKDDFSGRASSDPAKVREWWTEAVTGESSHANIGISTDDLLVLDFDVKNGAEGLADLEYWESILDYKHLVYTPSGGYHAYFKLPPGVRVAGNIKKIRPATDVRSWHNYVIGPGSEIDGNAYSWVESEADNNVVPAAIGDLDIAPQWVVDLCDTPREREMPGPGTVELDTQEAIDTAADYLKCTPLISVEGERGNFTAYKAAARVRDFAVSESQCLDLMLDHWNDRCKPSWKTEDLSKIVGNAFKYAKKAVVERGSEFETVTPKRVEQVTAPTSGTSSLRTPPPDWLKPRPYSSARGRNAPPRRWIVHGVAAREYLTELVAPSGAGKTQWLLQLALAVASDRGEIAGVTIKKPANVWLWNQEDNADELDRRSAAAEKFFNLDSANLPCKLFINSGVQHPLRVADNHPVTGQLRRLEDNIAEVKRRIAADAIGVFIADPLVGFHRASDENASALMGPVAEVFREIATEMECAVIMAHHTRKPSGASSEGFAGNPASARGSDAPMTVARIALTLYSMSQKDAKAFKVPEEDRSLFVRLDGAKANIARSAAGGAPDWFKFNNVVLQDAPDEEGDGPDHIGVLSRAELVKSRVEKERATRGETDGDAPADADAEAVAIADAMAAASYLDGQKYDLSKFKDAIGKILGKNTGRNSGFAKYPGANYGKRLAAGAGREIEIFPPVDLGKTIRVALWRQATSQPNSADLGADDKGKLAGADGADLAAKNIRTAKTRQLEWAQ